MNLVVNEFHCSCGHAASWHHNLLYDITQNCDKSQLCYAYNQKQQSCKQLIGSIYRYQRADGNRLVE